MNLRLVQRLLLQQLATNMGKKQYDLHSWRQGYARSRDDVDAFLDRLIRVQERAAINWRED